MGPHHGCYLILRRAVHDALVLLRVSSRGLVTRIVIHNHDGGGRDGLILRPAMRNVFCTAAVCSQFCDGSI